MANEKEANLARAQNSDLLRGLGAHSIGVDTIEGGRGFAVVAFFETKPEGAIPPVLKAESGGRTLDVPLVVGIMKMPSPETILEPWDGS
ncbi:MAG TPA: hypothetical protein VJT09_04320 [Pyrinomonadaceae bacterium]|nr:hypothetical protein [Pyrinomonadaceae bacterium]